MSTFSGMYAFRYYDIKYILLLLLNESILCYPMVIVRLLDNLLISVTDKKVDFRV